MNDILQKAIQEVREANSMQIHFNPDFEYSDLMFLFTAIPQHFCTDLAPSLVQLRVINQKYVPWTFYFAVRGEYRGSAIRFQFNKGMVYFDAYETILDEDESPPPGVYDEYIHRYDRDDAYVHTYLFFDKGGYRDRVLRDDGVTCFYIENYAVPYALQDQMEVYGLAESVVEHLAGWTSEKSTEYVLYIRPTREIEV